MPRGRVVVPRGARPGVRRAARGRGRRRGAGGFALTRTSFLLLAGLAGTILPLAALDSLRDGADLVLLLGPLATLAWGLLLWLGVRGTAPPLPVTVGLGVLLRGALLLPDEGLSDDVHRYVWEGRVLASGTSPYAHAPDDPLLAPLRDDVVWPRVTHKEVPAAYPPLAQAFFAGAASIGLGVLGLRAALVGVDLLVLFALVRLLRAAGEDPRLALAWGLSPLVLLEFAGSAHFDVLAVLFVVLAFLARARGRPVAAAAALGLATLAKPFAPVVLPFLLARRTWARQGFAFAAVVLAGMLPVVVGGGAFEGLGRYARDWSHNSLLHPATVEVLEAAKEASARGLESVGAPEAWKRLAYAVDPNLASRVVLPAILLAVVVLLWRRRGAPEPRAAWALGAFLLLAPTVHPWYLTWFVPFLAFRPHPPLVVWSGTVLLSYHVLATYDAVGVWREERAMRVAEYAPVLLLLLWAAVRPRPRAAGTHG
ncbi:MAG: glycosyltransferase 87 family protein [Planctomycetota bacterium JB042]